MAKPVLFPVKVWDDILNITAANVSISNLTINSPISQGKKISITGNGAQLIGNRIDGSVSGSASFIQIVNNSFVNGGQIRLSGAHHAGYSKNSPNYYKLHKVSVNTLQSMPYALSIQNNNPDLIREGAEDFANNTFYHNNFNGTVVRVWGKVGANVWSSVGEGNYWSNYNGSDINGDGVGDTPYTMDARNSDYNPLNDTGLADPYPLMTPFNGTSGVNLPQWAPSFVAALIPTPTPSPLPSNEASLDPTSLAVTATGVAVVAAVSAAIVLLGKLRLKKSQY